MALNYQLFAALTEAKTLSAPPVPEYRHYGAGDVILAEGEPAREVFVLNDGKATVSVRGARVGEVRKDEVFGALGALSGGVRTATVVADEMCDCTVFSKDSFQDLLRLNPKLMTKLFEDFGRALSDLNDSVSRAAGTKWSNLF
jgi:CRP-like cAMP-binding protein